MIDETLIAVPTRGQVQWQTVQRLCEIRDAHPGLAPVVWQPGNLSVALTRNRIVRTFLAGPWQTLVMVDDDVVPPPHMLDALLPVPDGFGAVAIPHVMPHPADPSVLALTAFDDAGDGHLRFASLDPGLNEVAAVATGCVAVTRAALVSLGADPFRMPDSPDEVPASDDFVFCRDLRDVGFKVGAWYSDWHCDHVTAVSLAPLHACAADRERSRV